MAKGGMPAGRLSRRILAAAFLLLLATASAAVFLVVPTRSVFEALVEGSAIAALSLLTAGLFALAWYLRERVLTPLEGLQRSQVPAGGTEDQALQGLKQLIERLSKDAVRLEADLALLSTATIHARMSIEESSVRAAKASFAAIEAAEIVRDGAERMTLRAGAAIAAQGHAPNAAEPRALRGLRSGTGGPFRHRHGSRRGADESGRRSRGARAVCTRPQNHRRRIPPPR